MSDKSTIDWLQQNVHFAGHAEALKKEAEAEEASAGAFGYLRGIKDRANAVEFRFKAGNTSGFPIHGWGHASTIPPWGCF